MKKTLKDLLVVCDIDNTLLTSEMQIPSCNVEMIRLFCALGGNFTVATGRTAASAKQALQDILPNVPAVVCGGSMVVDFATDQVMAKITLNRREATRLLEDVLNRFPAVGAEVMTETGEIYIVNPSEYTEKHIEDEKLKCFYAPYNEIEGEWLKILFADSPQKVRAISGFLADRYYYDLKPVMTNHIYYEIMPEKASKGEGLKTICRNIDFPLENTVAIGDYYNDIELMKTAGYSVAMGNAPAEVKLVADEITGNCCDGGVASYLYHLIKYYA